MTETAMNRATKLAAPFDGDYAHLVTTSVSTSRVLVSSEVIVGSHLKCFGQQDYSSLESCKYL
jgi:hypothetical protein